MAKPKRAHKLEVFRVRGKILSLALIVAMFGAFFVNIGLTQTPVTVYCDPAMVSGVYEGTFDINVMITGGEGVYAWEFRLDYPPYVQQLTVIDVIAGDYLGPDQILAKNIDYFNGEVLVGSTMQGDVEGAYGDGLLATVRFGVIESAGAYPIDMLSARVFIRVGTEIVEMAPEDITKIGSYFMGPTLTMEAAPGEKGNHKGAYVPGKTRRFKTVATNPSAVPLWARAMITTTKDTGATFTYYSGQHLFTTQPRATEYYYADGFTADFTDWAQTGTAPYVNAVGDGNLVTGNDYCQLAGLFTFADISLNPGDIIYRVTLEGYTRSGNLDIDFDVYDQNFNWVDSLWGTGSWGWHTTRWVSPVTSSIVPSLLTPAGFNDFGIIVHYYSPSGTPIGNAELDALRLKVEYIGLNPLSVNGEVVPAGAINYRLMDLIWDLWPFDVGTYTTTYVVQYRYGTPDPRFPQYWATTTPVTFTWTVYP